MVDEVQATAPVEPLELPETTGEASETHSAHIDLKVDKPAETAPKVTVPEPVTEEPEPEKVAESVPKVTPKSKSQQKKKDKHSKKKRRHGRS